MDKLKNKLLMAPAAYASFNIAPRGDFQNLGNIQVVDLVPATLTLILIIATVVCLLFLLIGGIKWITSSGDKAQLESARSTVTGALVGLFIVFVAWAILGLVGFFFGIDLFGQFTLPSIAPTATDDEEARLIIDLTRLLA